MIWMIIAIIVVFLIVFGLVGFVLGHFAFKRYNNPKLAWVFNLVGDTYKPEKGHLLEEVTDNGIRGSSYVYGKHNDRVLILYEKEDEKPVYWKYRRVLGVSNTNTIASPLGGRELPDRVEKPTLIRHLTLSHIGSDMLQAMSSTATNLLLIIIIIVVVVVAVAGGVMFFNNQSKNNQQQQTTQQTLPTKLPPSGEVP